MTITGPIEYQKEMDTDKESNKGTLEKKDKEKKVINNSLVQLVFFMCDPFGILLFHVITKKDWESQWTLLYDIVQHSLNM